jgi:hypothetical protein
MMKFICSFTIDPDGAAQAEAIHRFRTTGGQPPAGVRLLGRWTRTDFTGGFLLVETDDSKALTEFALGWSDLMQLDIFPVVDDPELVDVLTRLGR